jgi:hypothetical protein
MSTRSGALALTFLVSLASWGTAQSPEPAGAENPRIGELIRKLGSSSYLQREHARKELEAIGSPALDTLRRARKASDVETRRRIEELMRRCEEQLLTRRVLAPKEIELNLVDADVDQAIVELTRVSGYPIQFAGDRTALGSKKFTLATGKTSFWQALDRFCDEAGLTEKADLAPKVAATSTIVIRRGRIKQTVDLSGAPTAPEPIVLTPRGSEKTACSYAGAVKSQLRVSRDEQTKDLILTFVIHVEPRLLNSSVEGRPVLEKALDQQRCQLLERAEETKPADAESDQEAVVGIPFNGTFSNQTLLRRNTQIRLKEGEQAARLLKEVTGKLTLQVELANEAIVKVDQILQASGRTVQGIGGGTMRIDAVHKVGDDVEIKVTMDDLNPNPFGGNAFNNGVFLRGNNVLIRGGGMGVRAEMPHLLDAKGQKFIIADFSTQGTNLANGSVSQTATILYRPNPQQGAPSELVVFGTVMHTIAAPFRFENVPLP